MKKRLLIGRIIGFLGICLFAMGISYIVTYYLDKSLYQNIELLVTFEDTKEVSLNTLVLDETSVLETYPYIFQVKNNGKSKANYEINLKDIDSNIKRNNLNYILFLNDEEVSKGSLGDIQGDTLYKTVVSKDKTDTYKLYLYLNQDMDDVIYKYFVEVVSF